MKPRQEKELKCRECGDTFGTQEELKAHERECAGEESEIDGEEDVEGEESTEVNESVDDLGETEEQPKRRKREEMF
jgi:hypothetical protein